MTLLTTDLLRTQNTILHELDGSITCASISSSSELDFSLADMNRPGFQTPESYIQMASGSFPDDIAEYKNLYSNGCADVNSSLDLGHFPRSSLETTMEGEQLHRYTSDGDCQSAGSSYQDDEVSDGDGPDEDEPSSKEDALPGGSEVPRQKRKYRRKPPKDPNAPKPPKSAYARFADFQREDPDVARMTFTEIAKLVGVRWRQLSHKEKESWELPAKRDREQYKRDKAAYQKTAQYEEHRRQVELDQWRRKNKLARKTGAPELPFPGLDGVGDIYGMQSPVSSNYPSSRSSCNSHEQFETGCIAGFDPSFQPLDCSSQKTVEWQPLGSSPTSNGSLNDPFVVNPYAGYYSLQQQLTSNCPLPLNPLTDETIKGIINMFIYKINSVQQLVSSQWLRDSLELEPVNGLYLLALRDPLISLCMSVGYQSQTMGGVDQMTETLDSYVEHSWDENTVLQTSIESMRLLVLMSMHHQYRKPTTAWQYLNYGLEMGRQLIAQGGSNDADFSQLWTTLSTLRSSYSQLLQAMQYCPMP